MTGEVVLAACCRVWPIAVWGPLGRCGLCGERPSTLTELADEVYALSAEGRAPSKRLGWRLRLLAAAR